MRDDIHALTHALEERHWWFRGRRGIVRAVLERAVPPSPGRLVVDIGCGSGANVASLAGSYRAVGIDHAERAIAVARERHGGVEFRCGSIPDDVADLLPRASAVLLTDVLEHVPDDFLFLSQIVAPLPPGAHLLVTVPADPGLWSDHDVSHHHYRRYTAERLARVWSDLPVTVRLLSYFNARLYAAVKAVRTLGRRRKAPPDLAGRDDLRLPPRPANRLLEAVFAGERSRLLAAIDRPGTGYRRGVSLIALLRREAGECPVRARPADVAPDTHDPAA